MVCKPKRRNKLFLKQIFIDIPLISEIHFTTKNYFSLPRYKLYYTNHPYGTAHGGTAVLTKETIEHYELLKYEKDSIQATSIKVKGFPYEITITAHWPPRHNLKKEHFKKFFQTLGPKFIALGDYNNKHTLWGSSLTTTKRQRIIKGNPKEKLFISINWNTKILVY
jgi:hypothetical protein